MIETPLRKKSTAATSKLAESSLEFDLGLGPTFGRLLWSVGGAAAVRAKGLVTLPFALWILGPAGYGKLSAILATAAVIAPLGLMNIPDGAARLIVGASNDQISMRRLALIRTGGIAATAAVGALGFVSAFWFDLYALGWAALVASGAMAFKLGSVHLLYFQRTRTYVKLQTFMEYGAAGAGLAAAVFFGLNGMLVMNVFVALLIGGWGWRTLRTSRARPLRDPFWSAAVRIAVPLLPVAIAQWALFSADALLLLSMLGATAAGAYSTAYSLGSIALLFPLGLSAVWFPTAQRLLLRSYADLRATAVRVGIWITVWGVVVVSASLVARPLIDRVLSDSVYADVSGSVPFVVLGFVFFGFGKIGEGMLYASGAWLPIVGAYTAGAILNIALNVYWIPTYGIRGAAYATAAGYAATALILTASATKRPGLISA